jgi:NAD+ diphosphatase
MNTLFSGFTPGPDFILTPGTRPGRQLFLHQNRLLVKILEGQPVPADASDLAPAGYDCEDVLALGRVDGVLCAACRLPNDFTPPTGFHFEGLRRLFGRIAEVDLAAAGYALQLFRWKDDHRFCGRCGAATALHAGVRALGCTGCDRFLFPQVAPAVIVAVVSNKRLLLARARRYAGNMFSVVAGYVEPGETLEECVRREVHEEVGLEVDKIRYFGSQPWPFSGSLMVAFTAAHTGGEILVDHNEILEAGWFTAADLPVIPGKISIARQLIDWYVGRYGPEASGEAPSRRGSS